MNQQTKHHPVSIFIYDENRAGGQHLKSLIQDTFPFCEVTLLMDQNEAAGVLILKRFHIFFVFVRSFHRQTISEYSLHLLDVIHCLYPNHAVPIIAISPFERMANFLYTNNHCTDVWDIGYTKDYAIGALKNSLFTLKFAPQDDQIYLDHYPHVEYFQVSDLIYTDHSHRHTTFFLCDRKYIFHNQTIQKVLDHYHQYGFLQCNRFQIVNLAYVKSIHSKGKNKHLILKNDMGILNIGVSYVDNLLDAYSLFHRQKEDHEI